MPMLAANAVQIPTPAEVEAGRSARMLGIVAGIIMDSANWLSKSTGYPVSVPVHNQPVEAIGAAIEQISSRGWAVGYRPGDNMMLITPAE